MRAGTQPRARAPYTSVRVWSRDHQKLAELADATRSSILEVVAAATLALADQGPENLRHFLRRVRTRDLDDVAA